LITVEKEEKVDVYPLPSNIHQKSRKFHAQHKYMVRSKDLLFDKLFRLEA